VGVAKRAPTHFSSLGGGFNVDNPYAPPANESVGSPGITVYSPGQIAWAAFLGAPIAGSWLLALNYRRLGDAKAANLSLISGLIGTILVVALAFVLPERFPNLILPAAYAFGMYQYAKTLHGKVYESRPANGRNKGSGWVATGIGMLCSILILVVLFALVLVAPEEWLGEEWQ
jgi:hypothetical protein